MPIKFAVSDAPAITDVVSSMPGDEEFTDAI